MTDELRPGRAEMVRMTTTLRIAGESATVVSLQAGYRRQSIRRGTDRWGIDEPRLMVDFGSGWPTLDDGRQRVGERLGNTVRLWSREYRIHRQWLWPTLRFTVTTGERTVLRVRERFRRVDGARAFDTYSDAALDPVVTLALLLVTARPDRMSFGRGDASPP
ncbi:hypothetical protein [Streptomyces spongiae]|uniref:Uncharacterized protein n=1 Tax=Streptomyces spongiae TaxID=565072 RepID=A0A5N8XVC9_9ACTN|nr:hypothetical protein [Streptomyces spongiae]MPY63324.1 hypothetical protein [Streptomyces spongiae]